ncbi:MAG: branched-chain alpha-keto acid dehydrogenase subunit E2 [Deltaproteobacteria bacterium]|nr:branched-chain alpha-keto acid dehydrogenase subunit E2 [Deltaproteobacteria bacterium]
MGQLLEIRVPDIGDFDEVEVVEILVAKGDEVVCEDSLVSIESEKATMEIPSTASGVVAELCVEEGDRVSEGCVLVVLEVTGDPQRAGGSSAAAAERSSDDGEALSATESGTAHEVAGRSGGQPAREVSAAARNPVPDRVGLPHASPLVRRYARELGVSIGAPEGSGPHGRVLVDDLRRHVRERLASDGEGSEKIGAARQGEGAAVVGLPALPSIDHAAFGPVHDQALTRIQKVSGPALHRSWLNVPHVTHNDEVDLTEIERFRSARREAAAERGLELSPLLFVMKAVVVALRVHPTFRASLAPEGDRLIVKDYFHLGVAVETDEGLVVPVIRDVDRKGMFELAEELNAIAQRARDRTLGPDDLRGACFTISSFGGIAGSSFTPIVSAPEVAILGLSKTRVQPVWQGPPPLGPAQDPEVGGGRFEPRVMLPLSLSYDHRVIDGAEATRFSTRLARVLSDPMQLLL